jgi:hypothetical protein
MAIQKTEPMRQSAAGIGLLHSFVRHYSSCRQLLSIQ